MNKSPDPKTSKRTAKVSLVVAMANNRVIGLENKMPWHLPADLSHFKKTTMGHAVIMGRKTYQSIGFSLPGRHNIVLTQSKDFQAKQVTVASNIQQAIEAAGDVKEIMIIGGSTIYQQFLPLAERLYLTLIDLRVKGDTFFPDYQHQKWTMTQQQTHQQDENNPYAYQFITLDRTCQPTSDQP